MKSVCKRILMLLVTMVIVSLLAFAAFELIHGSAAEIMLGTQATPERVAELEAELGLDRPFAVRYLEWLAGFFTGDLGISYSYSQPVWELIAPKVGITLCLSLLSFALIAVVSIPLGLWASRGHSRVGDAVGTVLDQLCMAVPPFFTGILISWLFSITLRWFVHGQFPDLGADPTGAFRYLFFAAAAIAIPRIAMTVRMLRSTIQGEMRRDYVRTAISRGNDRGAVLRRHVLRNALVPVVTFLAQTMAEIVAAGIVVEQVFAIPGLGRLLVASISNRDYPVVQAIVVILAFWVVLAGTVADIVNQRIDPACGWEVRHEAADERIPAGRADCHRPHGGADPGRPGVDALRPGRPAGRAQAGGPLPGPLAGDRQLRPGHLQPGAAGGGHHLPDRPEHRGHRRGVRHGSGRPHGLFRRRGGRGPDAPE
ncbi:MAG: ABC transporter permease [Dysosmobacter welbionis]